MTVIPDSRSFRLLAADIRQIDDGSSQDNLVTLLKPTGLDFDFRR